MKLLRNPLVVGILALVAVIMVLYQVFGSKVFRARRLFASAPVAANAPAPSQPARAAAPAPKPVLKRAPVHRVASTNLEENLLPDEPIDSAAIEPKFKLWVSAPLRDPFLLLAPVVHEPGLLDNETNSPVASWTLQGIWNQTGSRLAVINDQVWEVGDVLVEGYKLIRIEQDEVWFQGPYRNERLGFPEPKTVPQVAAPTPRPAAQKRRL